jgi:hypothetical protein
MKLKRLEEPKTIIIMAMGARLKGIPNKPGVNRPIFNYFIEET